MLLRLMCGMLWVPTGLLGSSFLGVMHVCDPEQTISSTCKCAEEKPKVQYIETKCMGPHPTVNSNSVTW
jgi:hypothetical protein